MEELYYWGNESYTWKQLLYSISSYIGERRNIDYFFKNYSHNDNDGIWKKEWKQGEYLFTAWYCSLSTRQLIPKYYYAPNYTVNVFYPKRHRIVDCYGRIIPSGLLRKAYLDYVSNEADNPKPRRRWYWHYRGPKCRKWHTSRFKGDHGFLGNECRQTEIFKTEERELFDDLGIRIKYNRSRAAEVYMSYTDWDSRDTYGAIKRSWKRSKKKKQWM